jgi:hypothetical protein
MFDRIAKYSDRRKRAVKFSQYLYVQSKKSNDPLILKNYAKLQNCANYLVFHDYYTVDQQKLISAHTCQLHTLCEFCAARRGAKLLEKNLPKIEQVLKENPHLKPVMITLTVKNGDDFKERYDHLTKSLKTYFDRRRDFLKKGWGFNEFCKIDGAFYSKEVTKSKKHGFHPHVHILALVTDWIDREKLSSEWEGITGDSKIVDVRLIKSKDRQPLVDGLAEVFKYAVKFSSLDFEDRWEVSKVLRRSRLVGSLGSLRGIKIPKSDLDEPLLGLPYLELIYSYSIKKESYGLLKAPKKCTNNGSFPSSKVVGYTETPSFTSDTDNINHIYNPDQDVVNLVRTVEDFELSKLPIDLTLADIESIDSSIYEKLDLYKNTGVDISRVKRNY